MRGLIGGRLFNKLIGERWWISHEHSAHETVTTSNLSKELAAVSEREVMERPEEPENSSTSENEERKTSVSSQGTSEPLR